MSNELDFLHMQMTFPSKLYHLLEMMEKVNEYEATIRWNEDGKSFCILRKKEFCREIIAKYFKQRKFTSFTRQLNIYGFKQIRNGPFNGSYFHVNFIRGQKELLLEIIRVPIKAEPKPNDASPNAKPKSKKVKEPVPNFENISDSTPVMPFFPVIMNPGNTNQPNFQDNGYYVFYSPHKHNAMPSYPHPPVMAPGYPDYYRYGMIPSPIEFSPFPYNPDFYGMREVDFDRSRSGSIASTLSSAQYESLVTPSFSLQSSSDSNPSMLIGNNSFSYSLPSLIQPSDDTTSKYFTKERDSHLDEEFSSFCDGLLENDVNVMDF